MAQGPGEHRLGEVEAPAAVRGEGRVEGVEPAVGVEADPPLGVEAVALAGHRHVLGAAEPQPHRATGERGAERGDGREAVRLHLLAAEAASHPQALDGHRVAGQTEHVRDDLLGLAGVLGAALHEHLAGLVDERERGVGLEVEVLLAGDLGLAAEDVRRAPEAALDVTALEVRLPALEAPAAIASRTVTTAGSGSYSHLDGRGAGRAASRVSPRTQQTACPWNITSWGRAARPRLDAGIVDAGHVCGGEHPHDPGHGEGGAGSSRVTRAWAWGAWTGWACSARGCAAAGRRCRARPP